MGLWGPWRWRQKAACSFAALCGSAEGAEKACQLHTGKVSPLQTTSEIRGRGKLSHVAPIGFSLLMFAETINGGCRHSAFSCCLGGHLCRVRGVGFRRRKFFNFVCLMLVDLSARNIVFLTNVIHYLGNDCSNAYFFFF